MLSRIVLVCSAVAACLAAAGCAGGGGSDGGADVVAAFYPLAFAAEQIGGPGVSVRSLTPAGAEPHDIELSPRDVERLQAADVVLYLGGGFMPQVEQAVSGRDNAVDLLQASDGRAGAGALDPHVWLDPVRFAAIARRIGAALVSPEGAARLVSRLEALDGELRAGLGDCRRRQIVTAHAAFGYLADRYGLAQIALTGLAPEAEPPARRLEALVDEVRRSGATTVFVEPLVAPDLARAIAREAGVATAVLDPLEGLGPAKLSRGADYFSVMRANLGALRQALGCR